MSRYIDADALKETIVSNVYPVVDDFNNCDYGMFWTGGIEKAIDAQPTIEERKTGRWIWGDEGYHCSECFFHAYGDTLNCLDGTFKYCPYCGARMEEVKEDEQVH